MKIIHIISSINRGGAENHLFNLASIQSKDKNKVQNGYCGVTEVIDENVEVPISMSTKLIKLLAITRMPFTSASLLPIFLVASYFYSINVNSFSLINFFLCTVGVLFAHLSTNMFNDYFDNIDGTDFHAISNNYVSVTPLQIDLTKYSEVNQLSNWLENINY